MATVVPAKLKQTDIYRFAHRGLQVEQHKPIVAYWCYYWFVDQMHKRGLHLEEDECKSYMSNLVDKLLAMKAQFGPEDAVKKDNIAAQAYVEQFGLEVFERADKTMRANKVTVQTADTFQAAGTFLDLLQIWGDPNPEVVSKRKFAKYHAARIARAIKAGEDPNLTNPAPEQPNSSTVEPALDPSDPEVQKITDPRPATVEDVPDDSDQAIQPPSPTDPKKRPMWPPKGDPRRGPPSTQPAQTASPSSLPRQNGQTPTPDPGYFPQVTTPSQLPQAPAGGSSNAPAVAQPSMSPPPQNYYTQPQQPPHMPMTHSPPPPPQPPAAELNIFSSSPSAPQATQYGTPPTAPMPMSPPATYPPQPPPTSMSPPTTQSPQPPTMSMSPPPAQYYQQAQPQAPALPTSPPAPPSQYHYPQPQQPQQFAGGAWPENQPSASSQHVPAPQPAQYQPQGYNTDDASVAEAQKHAKWAISALNFDDVKTAVKELRVALNALGAQ